MHNFAGKNYILTGANRGIGYVILDKLAKCGANVWACARRKNIEFEKEINDLSRLHDVRIRPVYFDLENEDEVKAGIHSIIKEKKCIDGLINNAGIAYGGLMEMTSLIKLKEVFSINYFAQIQIIQLVARVMIRQKSGTIVNMASVGGIETQAGYLAYGSSKAALIWATKCISRELGQYGIRVNAVAPGLVQTQMGYYKSDAELNQVISRTSLGRMAYSSEVANAVLFLLSEEASFITGHIMTVDGGRA